jgi:hypothetical protein
VRKIILFALFLITIQSAVAQIYHKEKYTLSGKNENYTGTLSTPAKTEDGEFFQILVLAGPINPMLVVEDKKPYFALTKEINLIFPTVYIGKDPLIGQVGVEYSYVIRNGRNSHIRGYLDFLYPVDAGEYIAVLAGIGGGYFTDTKKSGLFPQLSFSAIIPACNGIAFQAYIRVRNTFMFKKEDSNVFDLSTGMGAIFYLGW